MKDESRVHEKVEARCIAALSVHGSKLTIYGEKSKIVLKWSSHFFEFSNNFPSGITDVLEDEGFDNLPALLSTDCHDLGGLKLKQDHITFVCEETKAFQIQIKPGEVPLYRLVVRTWLDLTW